MGVYDHERISSWDAWPCENSNTGIHDQVWISIVGYMNNCGYKYGICEFVCLLTLRLITKCEYQNGEKWPNENNNTTTHYQVWILTWGIYDQVRISA